MTSTASPETNNPCTFNFSPSHLIQIYFFLWNSLPGILAEPIITYPLVIRLGIVAVRYPVWQELGISPSPGSGLLSAARCTELHPSRRDTPEWAIFEKDPSIDFRTSFLVSGISFAF